ncbi:MAG: ABC transporter permease, partial [Planctomycetaceae bacterium]|nr:ABC transporter permease [Planctomycetaceae bacterium]
MNRMQGELHHPDNLQVAAAAALLAVNGAVSLLLRLGLGRRLLVAGLRTTVQLALIGLVLRHAFAS